MQSRKAFLKQVSLLCTAGVMGFINPSYKRRSGKVITVNGPVYSTDLGYTLIHEHILVDFIGAEQYDPGRWDREIVIQKILPLLDEVVSAGCKTLVDCTPNYLGRDVVLLKKLSTLSRLNIITNTGYYGGSDNKFLPAQAFTETADQLAVRWIREAQNGIDGTTIKPGFIKISVNPEALSEISQKLIRAAAKCHLRTGLTIASHTGPAIPAFEQLDILKQEGVAPDAFIWVHAQNETDHQAYVKAVATGAWVSLDGLHEDNLPDYVAILSYLKKEKCLHRVLVSHDAGWYDPAKPNGGEIRGYSTLFTKLIPALEAENFSEPDILRLIHINPRNAFEVKKRRA